MNENQATSSSQKPEFGRIRSLIWPVHGYELPKFLLMGILMALILFVYTMVRDLKDPLVQYYAVCGGPELIPQLKLFFVMPMAFLLVMVYSALINKFGFNKTFYIMVTFFTAFFAAFAFIFLPGRSFLHPGEETVRALQASWPPFLYWIIPCFTNWSMTLFYVFAELWGTMAISSLFWQFAYKATMKNEVKRFFGIYGLVGNLGVIASGAALDYISKNIKGESSIRMSVLIAVIAGVAVMGVFALINNVILKDSRYFDATQVKEKKKKEKIGVMDGIKMLFSDSYLLLIATIVICYGVGINFFEIIWKAYMKMKFTDPNDYQATMALLSQIIGVLTILVSIFGQNLLRKAKWVVSALIPAGILAIFGGIFFLMVLYHRAGNTELFGLNIISLAVGFGLIQDALTKSVKYCLFDGTKNIAYTPLDAETKTKGQAAVEVVGGRAGKAGASAIQSILTGLVSAGSKITSHTSTIAVVFGITAVAWIASVFKLGKKYEAKVAENAHQE